MKHWFLPDSPDVIGLLLRQADITIHGLDAFAAWSSGDEAGAQTVRDCEHQADDARRELHRALREAFSTPIDAEDLYALSERLDAVLNGAKNAVRESEVMQMQPDAPMAAMAAELAGAVEHLRDALAALLRDADEATAAADAAIRREREMERIYRKAMSDLLDQAELREVIGRRELYRRYSRLGEEVVSVAERVWYALVKGG
ncbi:MAG: DUF47 family protein [Acidimicrobiia bacterium]|nr:DUF47 family protein [Acidimicrobiia bacterium]